MKGLIFSVLKKITVMCSLVLIAACQPHDNNVHVEVLTKSHASRDMGVSITYPALVGIDVGDHVDMEVIFTVAPNQPFEVELIGGDAYVWGSEKNYTLQADTEGKAFLNLSFVAELAGRQYLKFLCTLLSDTPSSKVFSVPFTVDGGELLPAPEKIMLPAKQF